MPNSSSVNLFQEARRSSLSTSMMAAAVDSKILRNLSSLCRINSSSFLCSSISVVSAFF